MDGTTWCGHLGHVAETRMTLKCYPELKQSVLDRMEYFNKEPEPPSPNRKKNFPSLKLAGGRSRHTARLGESRRLGSSPSWFFPEP